MSKEALLYEKCNNKTVRCTLCTHFCQIPNKGFGICRVRQNINGTLYSHVYNKAVALNIDPIEKKPLYHFLPGSLAYSIATVGCNFKCSFCQNWQISQISDNDHIFNTLDVSPQDIVKKTQENNCASIAYTYTEPTIYFEYALDTAKSAKQAEIFNIFVSNGYMSKQAIDLIAPYLDAANIDLKSFSNNFYKQYCKATLQPVLDNIKYLYEANVWLEITTLIIPGLNDSDEELTKIAKFIASIDKNMPWHISRFHPNYQLANLKMTDIEYLKKAKNIGQENGLNYVYLGNTLQDTSTYCPNCQEQLITRSIFQTIKNKIKNGKCPKCHTKIAGIF